MKSNKKYVRVINVRKLINENYKIFSFYTIVCSTIAIGLSVTGKNIHAYSEPIMAATYSSADQRIFLSEKAEKSLAKHNDEITAIASDIKEENEKQQVFKIEEAVQPDTVELSSKSDIPSGLPLSGIVTSEYGERADPITGEGAVHKGIDIAADTGTAVKATADGTVISARYSDSYGYVVEVDHGNGYTTTYAHNDSLTVKTGDNIIKGQTVALAGSTGYSTGPHVHYEVKYEGMPVNPVSPLSASNE